MHYKLRNIYENLDELQYKLITFSLDNIRWSCLYSGMGIITPLTQKELEQILKIDNNEDNMRHTLNNYVPISCIYDKGVSSFTEPPVEILNPGMYMWDFDSFNKKISVQNQAYAILCLSRYSESLYEQSPGEGYLMVKTARMFYDFISTYLRNSDGLFVNGFDKTKNFEKKLKIKIEEDNAELYDQVIVFEAILTLYKTISNKAIKEYYTSKCKIYLNDALSLFNYLFDNYMLFLDLPTKELAQCISALSRCAEICNELQLKNNIKFIITNLCAELETRIKITGEVNKNPEDNCSASLITHFRATSAMLEGYSQTNITKFIESATCINNSLQDLYDSSSGLFLSGNHRSINYNMGDISEIIKYFVLRHLIFKDINAMSALREFYNSSLEKTSIIQSIVKNSIKINEVDYFLNENIPLMEEIGKAPIFLKNFKLKLKKKLEFETSKYFCSFNGLYSSYILLYYLDLKVQEPDPLLSEIN